MTKLPLSQTVLPASTPLAGGAPRASEGSRVGDRVCLILLSPGEKPGVQRLRNPGAPRTLPDQHPS